MLARSPTRTSPTSTAVGARNTSSPIVGATPSSSRSTAISDPLTSRWRDYTLAGVSQVSHVVGSGGARVTRDASRTADAPEAHDGERTSVVATAVEDLAPWTEEQVQAHLKAGKLVEGL